MKWRSFTGVATEITIESVYKLVRTDVAQGNVRDYVPVASQLNQDVDLINTFISIGALNNTYITRYFESIYPNPDVPVIDDIVYPEIVDNNPPPGLLIPSNTLKWVDATNDVELKTGRHHGFNSKYLDIELDDDDIPLIVIRFRSANGNVGPIFNVFDLYGEYVKMNDEGDYLSQYRDSDNAYLFSTFEPVISMPHLDIHTQKMRFYIYTNQLEKAVFDEDTIGKVKQFNVKFNGQTYEIDIADNPSNPLVWMGETIDQTEMDNPSYQGDWEESVRVYSKVVELPCDDVENNQATPIKIQVEYESGENTPFTWIYFQPVPVVQGFVVGDEVGDILHLSNSFGSNFKATKADWMLSYGVTEDPINVNYQINGTYQKSVDLYKVQDASQVNKSTFRKYILIDHKGSNVPSNRSNNGRTSVKVMGDDTDYLTGNNNARWYPFTTIEPKWQLDSLEQRQQPACPPRQNWDGRTFVDIEESPDVKIYLNSQEFTKVSGYSAAAFLDGETAYLIYDKTNLNYSVLLGHENGGWIQYMGIALDNDYKMTSLTCTIDQTLCVLGWKPVKGQEMPDYIIYRYELYFTKSTNRGATWTEPVLVDTWNQPFLARVSQDLVDGEFKINGGATPASISPFPKNRSINGGATWQN